MTSRIVIRRLRRDGRGLPLFYAVLVVLVAALSVAAPLVLRSAAGQALRDEVTRADDQVRTITVRQSVSFRGARLEGHARPAVAATRVKLRQGMAPSLRGVVGTGTYAAQSTPYDVLDARTGARPDPTSHQKLLLRAQSEALERVQWVRGAAPVGYDLTEVEGRSTPRVQVALETTVAAALHVDVDDVLSLTPERFSQGMTVRVTGVFAVERPDRWFWDGEPRVLVPAVKDDGNTRVITGAALFDPGAIEVVDALAFQSLDVAYRFPVTIAALDTVSAPQAVTALGAYQSWVRQNAGPGFDASSRLPTAVEQFTSEMSTTNALLSVALVGLGAGVATATALVAWLLVRRRSRTLELLRARGASLRQVALVVPRECAPVALALALSGSVLAVAALGREAARPIATGWALTLIGLALPAGIAASRHRRVVGHDAASAGAGRRVTLELTVAALTLGGLALLLRAGLRASGMTAVRAVVPTLLAVLIGLLVLRGASSVLTPLRRRASAGRSVVGLLVLTGMGRHRGASVVPVLVLVVTLAMATFGLVTTSTLLAHRPADAPASTAAALGAGPTGESPMVAILLTGLGLAGLGSAVCALLVLVVAQLGSRRSRAGDQSLVRTLGFSQGDSRRLVTLSLVPQAVVALVAGVLAGLAVSALVVATVDLAPFTGAEGTALAIEAGWLAALVGAFLLLAAVTVLAEAAADRHRPIASDLRAGVPS
ncbi:MAG TPA: FtsX-like permease family protein [Actinomycetes bacterium]|nr:FtsX-like permease family protein [Actinomycetes bacterium]